jgi:hypothetical protein
MRMRHLSFLSGALLGFLCGVMTMKVEASDPNNEIYCMAQNIYFEAGNQPLAGKIAVSQVVLNRVEHYAYPDTVCGVVYQAKLRTNWKGEMVPKINACQFSWYCDGKSDNPVDSTTWLSCNLDITILGRLIERDCSY